MLLGVFETMAHFIEDIEVILNVLNGAVLGEVVLERFDLFLGELLDSLLIVSLGELAQASLRAPRSSKLKATDKK